MKAIQALIIGTFIFVSMLSSIIGFWMFQEVPECTVGAAPKTVDEKGAYKDQFKAGEILRVQRDMESRCKMSYIKVWRTMSRDDTREMIASDEFRPTPMQVGSRETRITPMQIPDTATPGKYAYRVFISYQMNPLRDGTFELQPAVKFEVVE